MALGDKGRRRWIVAGVAIALALLGGSSWLLWRRAAFPRAEATAPEAEAQPARVAAVTALGRLEPLGEVVAVAAPPSLGGAKVVDLLVARGDSVRPNQIIARLDGYDRYQVAYERAQQEVRVAQAELAVVKAGAKRGEIVAAEAAIARLRAQLEGERQAQQARIARLRAEAEQAASDYQRYQDLFTAGAISESEFESRKTLDRTAQESLEEAQATLGQSERTLERQIQEAIATRDRIAEVRPVDVQRAEADVARTQAVARQAQADLELGLVRAPRAGQVLAINARPGEIIESGEGLIELGSTEQMVAIAEVYESDIGQVQLHQDAIITSVSGAFPGKLRGRVSAIGLKIGKRDVLDTDPTADVDVRVVEVDILLFPTDSQRVPGLTNAKVQVQILL